MKVGSLPKQLGPTLTLKMRFLSSEYNDDCFQLSITYARSEGGPKPLC